MKIIFLDIDGVLNNSLWFLKSTERELQRKEPLEDLEIDMFDTRCVELLNMLIKHTGAKIVVSSSWRVGRSIEDLEDLFSKVGIEGQIVGKTPVLSFKGHGEIKDYSYSVPRGCEIKAWLETNKSILGSKMSEVKYVILDDDSDMLFWQRDKFIWVDPYAGLTPELIRRAKGILNR